MSSVYLGFSFYLSDYRIEIEQDSSDDLKIVLKRGSAKLYKTRFPFQERRAIEVGLTNGWV